MKYIHQSIKRKDAKDKVKGTAMFPGDYSMANQLHMKVLFANRPHAFVREIDMQEALKMNGVIAIFNAQDVPNNEYGLSMPDQPVLCGPGSNKVHGDRVRFEGDQIAVVVAETPEIAAKACKRIKVVYEDLPIVTDVLDALQTDAPLLHPEKESNEFCHYKIRKGDVQAALEKCDVVIESKYFTPMQEHAYLQPEAGIAYLDEEGRITVVVAGQWTHEDQEQIAHALNLELEKVRVIYPAIGGAFGGREDMSVQIILALAVMRLHERGIDRPIKIEWNREESIVGHHKRHQYLIKSKWGANKDGKIIAADIDIYADGGAYAYTSTKVLGNATLMASGPYDIPNVRVDARAIYTNNLPGGAFRGFGGPQAAFQAEMQVNKLAEALNMDPVEIRMRNLFEEGSEMCVGSIIPEGVSVREVLEKCALESGWKKSVNGWVKTAIEASDSEIIHGLGIACGYKNIGFSFGAPENCTARITLIGEQEIEKAILYHAGADVGQGAHSAFTQFAAEALNVPIEKIELVASDTATSSNSGSASASRLTFMSGNSIIGAANKALALWAEGNRPSDATFTYRPPKTSPFSPDDGQCTPNFAYGYVAESVDVSVDTGTGELKINKVVCANDVGTAINPVQVEGQIEGAIVQAAGYTTVENFIQVDGIVKTRYLSTYLIPTILDIPQEVKSIIHEHPDPIGPYGARGMAEMPYMPFAPALVDAVHAATGHWFDSFPLNAERILQGLGKI